jgi:hypothetical protein
MTDRPLCTLDLLLSPGHVTALVSCHAKLASILSLWLHGGPSRIGIPTHPGKGVLGEPGALVSVLRQGRWLV